MSQEHKVMVIGEDRLIERDMRGLGGIVCLRCHLGQPGMLSRCAEALSGLAEKTFGGDCAARDVAYVKEAK